MLAWQKTVRCFQGPVGGLAPQPGITVNQPTMLKRKRAQQLERPGAKRARPTSKRTKTPIADKKPFCLLDLPAELRNLIYEKVAEEQTPVLERRELNDRSGLLDIKDQLRDEYLPIMLVYAVTIQIEVVNFDFQHIVTFLNRLSDAEVNLLPNATKPMTRPIGIKLTIDQPAYPKHVSLLERWLNRAGHPTKKGTMLNISYTLSKHHQAWLLRHGHNMPPYRPGEHYFRMWRSAVDRYIKTSAKSRGIEEAQKIRVALDSERI